MLRCGRRPSRRTTYTRRVDPIKQHRERRRIHLDAIGARWNRRRNETAFGQSLVVQHEAVTIPCEDLHAIEALAEEDEQVSIERIEAPRAANDGDETVMTASEIHRLGGDVDTNARRQRQHRRSSATSRATYAASLPGATSISTSPTRTTNGAIAFVLGTRDVDGHELDVPRTGFDAAQSVQPSTEASDIDAPRNAKRAVRFTRPLELADNLLPLGPAPTRVHARERDRPSSP